MKKIICIMGPTASGKTSLGIQLAQQYNGEVVSADSRMVYHGMEIGTAVPSMAERQGIAHHLIGMVEPNQSFTVVDWRERATQAIDDIIQRGKLPIVVGGTGLYYSTLLDNFEIPHGTPDMEKRAELEEQWKTAEGKRKIIQDLLRLDPDAQELVDLKNSRRVIRALEVCRATGKPFTQQLRKKVSLYDALEIGLNVPKEALEKRLSDRVDQQLRDGLLDEVKRLKERYGRDISPMQGFVYKELCQYLGGELTLERAKELIALRNRQYAKRQMTWFKRDERIQWVVDMNDAQKLVHDFLQTKNSE